MSLAVVLVTAPRGRAAEIARRLLEERLAACVNIVGPIRSMYWWQGKIEDDQEELMIIKTKKCLLPALKEKIKQVHPYTVPEIIALEPVDVLHSYLKWAEAETAGCAEG